MSRYYPVSRERKALWYRVTNNGHVWAVRRTEERGRFPLRAVRLREYLDNNGYLTVRIGRKSVLVHRIVCIAFHGPSPGRYWQVRHRNAVRTDNRATNLRWGTVQDNARDRVHHNRMRREAKAWELAASLRIHETDT